MAATYLNALRLFSRDLRLYLFTWALFGFSFFGVYIILLNLYLLRLGHGLEFIGLVNAVGPLAIAFASLPAGALGGRWGIRRLMAGGIGLTAVGFGLLPLGEFMPRAWQPGWIVAAFGLSGFGVAFYIVSAGPYLMGVTGPAERSHAFAVQMALPPLFAFAGNLVGGLLPGLFARTLAVSLDHPAPFRYPLMIAALLLVPAVFVLLAAPEVGAGRAQVAERGPAPYGLMVWITMAALVRFASEGAGRPFYNVYLDAGLHLPTAQIGAVSAIAQLLSAPAALAAPLLIARWGHGRTFVLGSWGLAFSLLLLALIPHWMAAALGFVGFLGTVSITAIALIVFSQEAVSPGWRATMSGAVTTALGVSFSGMALGGGYAITAWGYSRLFFIGALLAVAGALLFWACFVRAPREESAPRSVTAAKGDP